MLSWWTFGSSTVGASFTGDANGEESLEVAIASIVTFISAAAASLAVAKLVFVDGKSSTLLVESIFFSGRLPHKCTVPNFFCRNYNWIY